MKAETAHLYVDRLVAYMGPQRGRLLANVHKPAPAFGFVDAQIRFVRHEQDAGAVMDVAVVVHVN